MTELNLAAQAWWNWMVSMFLQVSLLIVIIGAIDLLIKRWAWPQLRYALWLLILVKLLLPPTWYMPSSLVARVQPLDISFNSGAEQTIQLAESSKPGMSPSTATGSIPKKLDNRESLSADRNESFRSGEKIGWQVYAMGFWLFGILLFSLQLARRIKKLRRWHKEQVNKKDIPDWYHRQLVDTAEKLKLESLPAIVFSKQAAAPAVYGLFRPVLLLPEDYFNSLSREEAGHVLLHELAHLKRGDLWVHGLCLLLQIIYWFNPLLIWVRKQMKHVREICCDLTVANRLKEETMKYHQTLLNTAKRLLTESVEPGMGLLGIFEEPFRVVTRLKWLKKEKRTRRRILFPVTGAVCLLMLLFILPMAGSGKVSASTPPVAGEGYSLSYKIPKGGALQYSHNFSVIERTEKNGETEKITRKDALKFSVSSSGYSGKNYDLTVTLDDISVHINTPWAQLLPKVDSIKGKSLNLVLSPLGRELELKGMDKFQYSVWPDVSQNAADMFRSFFPNFSRESFLVGDSWNTAEGVLLDSFNGLYLNIESVNTIEKKVTRNGLKCLKIITKHKGELRGDRTVKIRGNIVGHSTWYFAYEKGVLVESDTEFSAKTTKSYGGKTFPSKSDVKVKTKLVKW